MEHGRRSIFWKWVYVGELRKERRGEKEREKQTPNRVRNRAQFTQVLSKKMSGYVGFSEPIFCKAKTRHNPTFFSLVLPKQGTTSLRNGLQLSIHIDFPRSPKQTNKQTNTFPRLTGTSRGRGRSQRDLTQSKKSNPTIHVSLHVHLHLHIYQSNPFTEHTPPKKNK